MGKVYKVHKIKLKNMEFRLEENSKPANYSCKSNAIFMNVLSQQHIHKRLKQTQIRDRISKEGG